MKNRIKIYTDGAFSHKSGAGGWAMLIPALFLRDVYVRRGSAIATTNNRMELKAISAALFYAIQQGSGANVIIVTDSQYCITVATSTRHYETNADLITEIRRRMGIIEQWEGSVTFKWVKGHSTDTWNVLVDHCACRARDERVSRLAPKPPPG